MIRKIRNLITRAFVSLPGDDSGEFPITQVSYNGKTVDAEVIYPYGISGNLPEGSLLLKFNVHANEENRAVIGYRHDLRPKNLKPGEFQTGNFLAGSTIKFDEDGNIIEVAQGDKSITFDSELNITGGTVKITADVEIVGDTTFTGTVTANGKVIDDTHTHPILSGSSAPGPTGTVT